MYTANETRYDRMPYRRCGKSGLKLPAMSLGLWQNFGDYVPYLTCREMILSAFDSGITHFDLANNYGPPHGSAETTFGRVLREDLAPYRDELIISTKAGYYMYPGPYGEYGSRKYLVASLDQSLKRMGLDYVDIYYSHRYDPDTPLEETMGALADCVKQGKALYVGISNYGPAETKRAAEILKEQGVPLLIHQPNYSMLDRWIENGLLDVLEEEGAGCIVFSPLAQGFLTGKYLNGIPADSRVAKEHMGGGAITADAITAEKIEKVRRLNEIAEARGQTMAQMALSWVLRGPVTSVIIGASRLAQIEENLKALDRLDFSEEELANIEAILLKRS